MHGDTRCSSNFIFKEKTHSMHGMGKEQRKNDITNTAKKVNRECHKLQYKFLAKEKTHSWAKLLSGKSSEPWLIQNTWSTVWKSQ
jgi:hypothetical protein